MNVRTNTMRVYNDCLIDDVARETGSDIMRISSGGSDPNCECAAWEGTLISLTGKTKGLPTYDQAKAGGCFHPNCTHTLEVVDEYADADEIRRAQEHPFEHAEGGDIWEEQDNRKYEIDQAVKIEDHGLTTEQAKAEVDRDNLSASIRAGLISENAERIVSGLTDLQIAALCRDGNPPEFEPFKPTKAELKDGAKERWNHGKWGGVVHIAKDATAEKIAEITGTTERQITFEKAKAIDSAYKSDGKTLVLSPIDKTTASEIHAACGITPKKLTPTVGGNEIRHTFNRHGKLRSENGRIYGEKSKRQVPITAKDISLIPEIIKSHDRVEAGSLTKWDNMPSVKFVKTMPDGTTYTVFVVADTLSYKTMWKKK